MLGFHLRSTLGDGIFISRLVRGQDSVSTTLSVSPYLQLMVANCELLDFGHSARVLTSCEQECSVNDKKTLNCGSYLTNDTAHIFSTPECRDIFLRPGADIKAAGVMGSREPKES